MYALYKIAIFMRIIYILYDIKCSLCKNKHLILINVELKYESFNVMNK